MSTAGAADSGGHASLQSLGRPAPTQQEPAPLPPLGASRRDAPSRRGGYDQDYWRGGRSRSNERRERRHGGSARQYHWDRSRSRSWERAWRSRERRSASRSRSRSRSPPPRRSRSRREREAWQAYQRQPEEPPAWGTGARQHPPPGQAWRADKADPWGGSGAANGQAAPGAEPVAPAAPAGPAVSHASTAVQASRAMQSVVDQPADHSPRTPLLSTALRDGAGEARVLATSPTQVILALDARLRGEEHKCLKAAIQLLDKQKLFMPRLFSSLQVMEQLTQRVDALEARLADLELQARNVNANMSQAFPGGI
eukprot:g2324.t1